VIAPNLQSEYLKYHSKAVESSCSETKMPVALENDRSIDTAASDEQAFYNYPILRLPQNKQQQKTVNTYYFRFNETTRIYFEVDSHFVQSHLTLKLS